MTTVAGFDTLQVVLEQQRAADRRRLAERFADVRPVSGRTQRQMLEERRAAAERPGIAEGIGHAISSEWAGAWAMRQFERGGFDIDPDFIAFSGDQWKELTAGLPEDMWSGFDRAVSLPHAMKIREQLLEVADSRQKLASMGWSGAALRIGASILDPVAIAADVGASLVPGVAPAVYGARLTRLQRLVRGGFLAASSGVAIEGYLATQDPERDARDVLYVGAGSFILAGGANALFKPLEKSARQLRKSIELADATESGLAPTAKGSRYYAAQLDDEEAGRISRDLTDMLDIEDIPEGGAADAIQPAPMADKRVPDIAHNGVDLNFADMGDVPRETGLIGRARYSMTGRLMRSEVPAVRRLGRMLADDALAGTRPGDMKRLSASEWVTQEFKVRMARYYRTALNEFEQWADANQIGRVRRFAARSQFMIEVGRAVRRAPGSYTTDPHVNAVADLMRHEHRELLNLAKRYEVNGFADVPELDTYLMRVHNRAAIDRLVKAYGEDQIALLVSGAIQSVSSKMPPELAQKVARAYLKTIRKVGDRTEVQKARLFSQDSADDLARMLREAGEDITPAEAEILTNRAKHRLDLDETYQMVVTDKQGRTATVGIEDLLENNAEALMNVYTRQVLGASAMSQVMRDFIPGQAIRSLDELVLHLQEAGKRAGRNIDADVKRLDVLARSVMGYKLGDDTATADVLRLLRGYQYLRVGNQFGFAQIAELGSVISQAGMTAVLQQMPALRSIYKRAVNGKLENELFAEVEAISGTGTDFLRHQVVSRFESDAGVFEHGATRAGIVPALQQLVDRGGRITSSVSGLAPINTFLQRSFAVAAAQRWMNIAANTGRKMSAKRLASMGLDEAMADRIAAQMRKHVITEPGMFGRRVRRLNLDAWDDAEAASNFIASLDIWSRRVVQENDIGNLAMWMTTDFGRTLLQFRAFVAVAWEKQFLHGLRMHDLETFTHWAATMAFGGLAYALQQAANAIGRDDREAWLARRLTPEEIGKAAFQRSGWSSLWPSIIDTAAPFAGFNRPFSFGRTSQMGNDLVTGNPTSDFIVNVGKVGLDTAGDATRAGREFTDSDREAMRKLLPFQNVLGVKAVLDAILIDDRPDRSR